MDIRSLAERLTSPLRSARVLFISHTGDFCQW
jgi:hypothetical protein